MARELYIMHFMKAEFQTRDHMFQKTVFLNSELDTWHSNAFTLQKVCERAKHHVILLVIVKYLPVVPSVLSIHSQQTWGEWPWQCIRSMCVCVCFSVTILLRLYYWRSVVFNVRPGLFFLSFCFAMSAGMKLVIKSVAGKWKAIVISMVLKTYKREERTRYKASSVEDTTSETVFLGGRSKPLFIALFVRFLKFAVAERKWRRHVGMSSLLSNE